MKGKTLLFVVTFLAAVAVGILTLFLIIYSAWIESDTDDAEIFGFALNVSIPLVLGVLLAAEFVAVAILFMIVRQFRK